jgi:hypothetical protein
MCQYEVVSEICVSIHANIVRDVPQDSCSTIRCKNIRAAYEGYSDWESKSRKPRDGRFRAPSVRNVTVLLARVIAALSR